MQNDDINKKTEELAAKILEITGSSLFLNLRFLIKAVTSLPAMPYKGTYATDGRRFYYSPAYLLKRYKAGERLPAHDHLHAILHCVFRHWFIGGGIDSLRWNAACDIAVESLIAEIGLYDNENKLEKSKIIDLMHSKMRPLTAERLYSYFKELPDETVEEYAKLFCTDDHNMWYKPAEREYEPEEKYRTLGLGSREETEKEHRHEEHKENGGVQPDSGENCADKTEKNDRNEDTPENGGGDNKVNKRGEKSEDTQGGNSDDSGENGGAEQSAAGGDGNGFEDEKSALEELLSYPQNKDESRLETLKQLEDMWRNIAKQIQMELGHFTKNAGKESEELVQALEEVNRDHYDYAEFLKKFAVRGEVMKLDTDSFDVNYYCYGMSVCENAALIEPLEYKEVKRIRDFVIAIDTSGSVSGALVQNFVQKTYDILNNEKSFFENVNIHIIQCDTEVREAVKITNRKELESYIAKMELKGLGGTDFRPVFDYVKKLLNKKEFTALKGLIYFTDGWGEFPPEKPPYETAFVFMRSDYSAAEPPDIPPWAIKLILDDKDIMQ